MLTDPQIRLLAETLSNIGIVFFASLVVPTFVGSDIDLVVFAIGIALSFVSWLSSLLLAKNLNI
ncbi:hypothetical protein A2W54_01550 [Candidatus Giovannonibacteria bacterium RIFCSPHIGHO2_02_43_13]|uniref:Uncharacterized protein n=1 Tax=Candidatus Giovannonibacteria bacterium RIFCSPHIGHO2_02_43_13 TaxID=1798330 RepID=A0A1F5WUR5_9BACT|nr:MAG: hypothetical protein A3E06_01345 [Candidatus Giovannonibacteria bacterium RIFCSPHIGHO2_12_FULL_44_42]OGF79397.1 MAG: hypothetical protein A2W54_01550 [Candidatus Giovannonibacteria bacterium RIFCSPHIGHO2_02_43_13]OGF89902.1 MAG: hypothetical protein A3I94_00715 [Candidatus Giovannonibacteria bacterium RIFCSPLOWO2_02_FULL_43_54]OGF97364.1 MAG: hypothetical protein A3H08_03255 [Candidatus Giovannonibacteria bacterium RIFCSPLOWO2_12_FULL_44_32]